MKKLLSIVLVLGFVSASAFAEGENTCRVKFNFGSKKKHSPNGRVFGRMREKLDAKTFDQCLAQVKKIAATPLEAEVDGVKRFEFPESIDYTYENTDVTADGNYLDKKFTRIVMTPEEKAAADARRAVETAVRNQ